MVVSVDVRMGMVGVGVEPGVEWEGVAQQLSDIEKTVVDESHFASHLYHLQ